MSKRSGPEVFGSIPSISGFSGNVRNYHANVIASVRACGFRNAFMTMANAVTAGRPSDLWNSVSERF
ncbi:hypothetical protein [Burkholderia sp. Bp9140]|uniref:hypothetical protein n=1 Tax=Burkholderia sp. Bp9140 TaxID=2184572 RepID=UPI000F55DFB7|nr:hypothetical protein [Burkholderia sp. Bp9140]